MSQEVKITTNESFQVAPRLDCIVYQAEEGPCLEQIGIFDPDLEVRGSLRFIESQPYSDTDIPYVSPAGPILPIIINASLDHLSKKQIRETGLILEYDSKSYRAVGHHDNVELKQDGHATVHIWSWIDEKGEEVNLIFPREKLSEIKYTLKYPNYTR